MDISLATPPPRGAVPRARLGLSYVLPRNSTIYILTPKGTFSTGSGAEHSEFRIISLNFASRPSHSKFRKEFREMWAWGNLACVECMCTCPCAIGQGPGQPRSDGRSGGPRATIVLGSVHWQLFFLLLTLFCFEAALFCWRSLISIVLFRVF